MSKISEALIVSLYAVPVFYTVGLAVSWLYYTPIPIDGLIILTVCFGLLSILMAAHLDLGSPSARRFDGWM